MLLEGKAREDWLLLGDWLAKAAALPFDQQLYSAFKDVLAHFSDEKSAYGDLSRVIQSYLRQRDIYRGFRESDPWLFDGDAPDGFDRWWLAQVKAGAVADTPDVPEAVRPDALVIGTPQKIIDAEVYRKHQFWLDIGSREWARSDNAPLYNAWVHSAVWDGSNTAFSEAFNEAVIRARAGHITRTLMLLATGEIRIYASELDDFGFAQAGLLPPRLPTVPPDTASARPERAVLRPDQAPVLAYRSGTMAISAVPGAGKTFVNVELLLELIAQGVEPDRILVLTYMDSAARTLLGRLRKKLGGITPKLPVVSTIHSLALRILTENDHALLIGALPEDLTILDEMGQAEILAPIAAATLPESVKDVAAWQKTLKTAIGHAKTFGLSPADIREQHRRMPECFRLAEFLPALEAYGEALRRSGSVDFTDLILNAVGILRDYPDVREAYRQRFRYIIEDEAQDSSRLLQGFIRLLGGDRPNLIRTGDTNQSITTTFSSAEPAVFREFTRQADQRVHMDHSGRCAPEIIALANFWMSAAGRRPGLEQAFESVAMRPVPGKNPTLIEPPDARLFETDRREESWLVERVAAFRRECPEASVAVLVRGNHQVNRVAGLLQEAGIQAVGLSDALNAHPVFKGILACLRLLAEPGDLTIQGEWSRWMTEAGLLPDDADVRAFLDGAPLLYAQPAALADEALRQWHYDLLDFSRQAVGGNVSELIARIADRLCAEPGDRSNGYLCALMAGEILEEIRRDSGQDGQEGIPGSGAPGSVLPDAGLCFSPLEIVIRRFEAFQRSWRGRKGFTDVLARQADQVVQVMTLHKSKGQEFDIVFMPFLQTDAFRHDLATVRFDESDKLIRDLDRVAARVAGVGGSGPPADYTEAKKREKIEEEARLVYVGLTRARRALLLSAHRQSQRYGKPRPSEPALAFRLLADHLAETAAGEQSDVEREA
jgi:DNA helicase-2/ATP-dependent DNA helicase PcrA